MKVYLVRHGETNWNLQQRIQGAMDVGLNERGRSQARQVCKHIPDTDKINMATSPLRRARQTAEIIKAETEVNEFWVMNQFRELDQGYWDGLRVKQVLDVIDPRRYTAWQENPLDNPPPGGENLHDLRSRVKEGLSKLIAASDYPLLVVGHKVVNSMIAHLAGDWPLEDVMDSLPDNAAIYSVNIDKIN